MNSEGKNVFWSGFKCRLAVGSKSQYILQFLYSSGNLNDGKAAIPLLKGIKERLLTLRVKQATMDAGYDYDPIYEQVHRIGAQSVIAIIRKMSLRQLDSISISHRHLCQNIAIVTTAMM